MNTIETIRARRSIRRFKSDPIPRELVEELLAITVQAPSAKNGQPWRLVVLEGQANQHLAAMMAATAESLLAQGLESGSLAWTARSMAQAPLTIVILNTPPPDGVPTEFHDDWNFVMDQSTGGAIQTLLLAATERGLGSLWICDILYVHDEVLAWLERPDHRLIAAVTLGYADESPNARPRHPWQECTEWRQ